MGTLLTVEGLDGAGKRTLTEALVTRWRQHGASVATLSFPRYKQSIHADLAAEALTGAHGDLLTSAYAMATLFALDRREAVEPINQLLRTHDVLIIDRYVASNAAYTAARLGEDAAGDAVRWVAELEYTRIGLPLPSTVIYLDVPVSVAAQRAASREAGDTSRTRDRYETDGDLQRRTGDVYRQLARSNWMGQWVTHHTDDPLESLPMPADHGDRANE